MFMESFTKIDLQLWKRANINPEKVVQNLVLRAIICRNMSTETGYLGWDLISEVHG